MPVVNTIHFHAITLIAQTQIQSLHYGKRDFGITTSIIVYIIAGVAGVTIAAIAMTKTAMMVETVNVVISKSAEVL